MKKVLLFVLLFLCVGRYGTTQAIAHAWKNYNHKLKGDHHDQRQIRSTVPNTEHRIHHSHTPCN